jgi:hypothetical protein
LTDVLKVFAWRNESSGPAGYMLPCRCVDCADAALASFTWKTPNRAGRCARRAAWRLHRMKPPESYLGFDLGDVGDFQTSLTMSTLIVQVSGGL